MSDPTPILVVDDSALMCKTIADLLTSNGYDVTEVYDGLDAITAVKNKRFHLVTLDVEMPKMAGIEVLRILKKMDPDLCVIMVSGQSSLQTALQAIRQGAYDYISKPFEPEDMLFSVQRAVKQRSLLLENRRLIEDLRSLNENLENLVRKRTRELLESNEQLEAAYMQLKELDALKVKFIMIASHELRTPLTTLRGYAGWLASRQRTPEQQSIALAAMEKSIERLVGVVSEITDIATLREKRMFLHKESVDLSRIIGIVVHEMRPFLEERRQALVLEIEDTLPAVYADKARVHQVLSNLVLNAVRFTPDGGRITIGASKSDSNGFAHIRITDTGIGIREDQLDKIFQEFYEAAPSEHHHSGTIQFQSGGIGLGLSVVRGIIEEHGGRIWAESTKTPGEKGSTFHFLLPLHAPEI